MSASQQDQIISWMRKRPLTAMGAFDSLDIVNLSGRISELRQQGYVIQNDWQQAPNRFGKPTRFVRYWLLAEPKQAA